ncbi:MAG: NADH-quinone oxidoreductase subunit H [Deltaproteobacteria bacterium]|nr:NADH-quinone oxidoreductase subunit H [Deltaproteobacteria bacterium]
MLQQIADKWIAGEGLLGGVFQGASPYLVYSVTMLIGAILALVIAAHLAGIYSWAERRIAGRIQSRIGPNRVGPQGFLQWAVDGLKTFQKEDLIPQDADSVIFRIAPYLSFCGMFLVFVVLPFSNTLVVADLNIGIVYILAVSSIEVLGVMLAGYGSNSKWAFYGGMRSAAQLVSYEIPVGLALLSMVLLSGSLNLNQIVLSQSHEGFFRSILAWNFFATPFAFIAFFAYFTAAIAEINRAPFDLPEAESELVAGFCTEYSGMRFLFFFFAEWANIFVISMIAVVVFFGGWTVPGVHTAAQWEAITPYIIYGALILTVIGATWVGYRMGVRADEPTRLTKPTGDLGTTILAVVLGWGPAFTALAVLSLFIAFGLPSAAPAVIKNAAQFGVIFIKAHILVFLVIQLRWTVPRLRVDQLMMLCWKYLMPVTFVCILGNMAWIAFIDMNGTAANLTRVVLFALTNLLILKYILMVVQNLRHAKANFDFKLAV